MLQNHTPAKHSAESLLEKAGSSTKHAVLCKRPSAPPYQCEVWVLWCPSTAVSTPRHDCPAPMAVGNPARARPPACPELGKAIPASPLGDKKVQVCKKIWAYFQKSTPRFGGFCLFDSHALYLGFYIKKILVWYFFFLSTNRQTNQQTLKTLRYRAKPADSS